MPKQIQITIPEPCQEKWEEMTPTQQGAYCQVCSKNVVDFTTKTENEIYEIVTNAEDELCCRLTSFQLQQPIRKTEINNGWFNWRAIAASLAALVAFELTLKGESLSKATTHVAVLHESEASKMKAKLHSDSVIVAQVVSEHNDPLMDAHITWANKKGAAVADDEGYFSIVIDSMHTDDDLLIINYIGYIPFKIRVSDLRRTPVIKLTPAPTGETIEIHTIGKIKME